MDVEAFEFFENFSKDRKLKEDTKDFSIVNKSLIEHFVSIEDPCDVIRRAVDTGLNSGDLLASLKSTYAFYSKNKFNDEAKFCLLRNVAMKVPNLASFSVQRCATEWESLKVVINDFEDGKRAFSSEPGSYVPHISPTASITVNSPRILVRLDSRVANVEHNIDTLAQ